MVKRNYYSTFVDKSFENTFEFKDEKERQSYFKYCQFYGNMGSLSDLDGVSINDEKLDPESPFRNLKYWLYLLYLLALPLNGMNLILALI